MYAAVLDTCVLYSSYLRDTLLRLAAAELYRPLWSEAILTELANNLPEQVDRAALIQLMRSSFPDAAVLGGEELIDAMTNDPKDRHVLATAVRANAAAIVTYNLTDFPDVSVKPYGIEVIHPDEFLQNQLDLAPGLVLEVLRKQASGYRKPEMDTYALAAALERADCPSTASEIRMLVDK